MKPLSWSFNEGHTGGVWCNELIFVKKEKDTSLVGCIQGNGGDVMFETLKTTT